MSDHSPLPWSVAGPATVVDRSGYGIAGVFGGVVSAPPELNAEFIVRACNSHEDLLLALKHARHNLALCHERERAQAPPDGELLTRHFLGTHSDWMNRLALGVIDAAIAKAESR